MPVEEITHYLGANKKDERKNLYMQLAIHCAPFLKGLKESAMLTLPRGQAMELARMAQGAGLSWYFLLHENGRDMVFLYRKRIFEEYLSRPDITEFLRKYGYFPDEKNDGFRVFRVLSVLSERMAAYYRTKKHFPHEIGVLLGYPQEDVEGFVKNGGRNCLLTGYWKVYHNEQEARRLFAAYDEARETAVREVLEGKGLLGLCAS